MSNKRASRRSSGYEVSICCNILILGVFCIMNTKFIRVYINILDIWLKVIHVQCTARGVEDIMSRHLKTQTWALGVHWWQYEQTILITEFLRRPHQHSKCPTYIWKCKLDRKKELCETHVGMKMSVVLVGMWNVGPLSSPLTAYEFRLAPSP